MNHSLILWLLLLTVSLLVFSLGAISLTDKQIPASFFGGNELFSPGNWVQEDQIKVYSDKVVLNIPNAIWAEFTNTNSMDPFLDETANALEIYPANPESINVGDIISYHTSYGILIHRVIEKGHDENGIYYLVKGDNNRFPDPYKVRYRDVRGVVVAIVY